MSKTTSTFSFKTMVISLSSLVSLSVSGASINMMQIIYAAIAIAMSFHRTNKKLLRDDIENDNTINSTSSRPVVETSKQIITNVVKSWKRLSDEIYVPNKLASTSLKRIKSNSRSKCPPEKRQENDMNRLNKLIAKEAALLAETITRNTKSDAIIELSDAEVNVSKGDCLPGGVDAVGIDDDIIDHVPSIVDLSSDEESGDTADEKKQDHSPLVVNKELLVMDLTSDSAENCFRVDEQRNDSAHLSNENNTNSNAENESTNDHLPLVLDIDDDNRDTISSMDSKENRAIVDEQMDCPIPLEIDIDDNVPDFTSHFAQFGPSMLMAEKAESMSAGSSVSLSLSEQDDTVDTADVTDTTEETPNKKRTGLFKNRRNKKSNVVFADTSKKAKTERKQSKTTNSRSSKKQNDTLKKAKELNNNAVVLTQKGDFLNATKSFEKANALFKQVLGNRDVVVATTLYNIGMSLDRIRKSKEAMTCYKEALALLRSCGGDNRLEVADVLYSIGHLHLKRFKYEKALISHKKSLAIRKEVLGKHHALVAKSLKDIDAAKKGSSSSKMAREEVYSA